MVTPIPTSLFLRLVDEVLTAVGRQPLRPEGPQRRIIQVEDSDRVVQILAGPGSGKTEMLVWRVLYELFVRGTPSDRVMVTTFTRRAATELQVRVVERCDLLLKKAADAGVAASDPRVHDLRIGTIHSLCDALLAEFDSEYADSGTQMVDDAEITVRIVRDHRFALGYGGQSGPPRVLNRLFDNPALTTLFKAPWDDSAAWPTSMMDKASCIAGILGQHTETWIPRCAGGIGHPPKLNGIEPVHGPPGLTDDLVKLQGRWEQYLAQHQILDFTTIQKRFLERQHLIRERLTHVFVDEFQDNNPIQFALHIGWLANPATRVTVVGDDDQAIYRFRGSDIDCFNRLEPHCLATHVPYRLEKLEINHRSTQAIVSFCQAFKINTVLQTLSMPKHITAAPDAESGVPVRLVQGKWVDLCACVASELDQMGAGKVPQPGQAAPPSAAVLVFSTSERSGLNREAAALTMRRLIEAMGIRVYNPRNKMAAAHESPVAQLMGLISYLIDPISNAPAGKKGRDVMVAASMEVQKRPYARTQAPSFPVSAAHLEFQKKFMKCDGGGIGFPSAKCKPVVDLVDEIREGLVAASASARKPRLTLAGFVARLLALPFFRDCGFTPALFRQALFTELLEANVAPTRRSMQPLDAPLEVTLVKKKYVWPDRYWTLLNVFGAYLSNASLDDPEVETFEDDAVLMITFHQGKGLEFDHVYVAGTGRPPDIAPALRTKLFSGDRPKYKIDGGQLSTKDKSVLELAAADREREVYVAMSRAKRHLTVLHDPENAFGYMPLNPAIEQLFEGIKGKSHPVVKGVTVREWKP